MALDREKEIDERTKAVYNDCWKIYREYTDGHDMRLLNRRIGELKKKHGNVQFLQDILLAFTPVYNSLHAEYLMKLHKQEER